MYKGPKACLVCLWYSKEASLAGRVSEGKSVGDEGECGVRSCRVARALVRTLDFILNETESQEKVLRRGVT